MKRELLCLVALFPLFLSGTSVPENDCQSCDTLPFQMDTTRVREFVEKKLDSMARLQINKLDSIKQELEDTLKNLSKKRKLWLGRVDLDARPDGTSYEWKWWYIITGDDTVWYKTEVKPIQ